MKETKTHDLYIRGVSKELKNALKVISKKNNRSLSSEILHIISKSVDESLIKESNKVK